MPLTDSSLTFSLSVPTISEGVEVAKLSDDDS